MQRTEVHGTEPRSSTRNVGVQRVVDVAFGLHQPRHDLIDQLFLGYLVLALRYAAQLIVLALEPISHFLRVARVLQESANEVTVVLHLTRVPYPREVFLTAITYLYPSLDEVVAELAKEPEQLLADLLHFRISGGARVAHVDQHICLEHIVLLQLPGDLSVLIHPVADVSTSRFEVRLWHILRTNSSEEPISNLLQRRDT